MGEQFVPAVPDLLQQADQANRQVVRLAQAGQYREAAQLGFQVLSFIQAILGPEHPAAALALNNLATIYHSTRQYAQALHFYQQALQIQQAQPAPDHPDLAQTLNNLGALYQDTGDLDRAEALYQQALRLRIDILGAQHSDVGNTLNNLASLLAARGRLQEARMLYESALANLSVSSGSNDPYTIRTMVNLADVDRQLQQFTRSEQEYSQAIDAGRSALGELHPFTLEALSGLARLYFESNQLERAETAYTGLLHLQQAAPSPNYSEIASLFNSLGVVFRLRGDYANARQFLQQSLELNRQLYGEESLPASASLNALAQLLVDLGDYGQAEALYRQALNIRLQALGPQHLQCAEVMNNLGECYRHILGTMPGAPVELEVSQEKDPKVALAVQTGRDTAEYLYREAAGIVRQNMGEMHPLLATVLNNLALLFDLCGDYVQAEPLYRQAGEIWLSTEGGSSSNYALSLNNLGALYYLTGRYIESEACYQQAGSIWAGQGSGLASNYADNRAQLAGVYALMGRMEDALQNLETAARSHDVLIGEVFAATSESQRLSYVHHLHGHFNWYLSLAILQTDPPDQFVRACLNLVLRRKGLSAEALAAQRDALVNGHYPNLAEKLSALRLVRTQINELALAGPGREETIEYRQQITAMLAHKDELESSLAAQIPEIRLQKALAEDSLEAVTAALPPGAALVEFVSFEPRNILTGPSFVAAPLPRRYLALVLVATENWPVRLINLGREAEIDALIDKYRASLGAASELREVEDDAHPDQPVNLPSSHAAGHRLREKVFDPLLEALRGSSRLFLSPDSSLARLPFEALPLENGGYLIDHYTISYLSAGRDLLRFDHTEVQPAGPPLVIADPDFDLRASGEPEMAGQFPPAITRQSEQVKSGGIRFRRLPGTRLEGEQIALRLGVQPWLSGASLKTMLRNSVSPRLLHLATHGFFLQDQYLQSAAKLLRHPAVNTLAGGLENPLLRSGLALAGANTWLAGGSLPAEAEDGMLTAEDVTAMNLLSTELVVLSACETGLGQVQAGEGVFGLRRAFVLAGAKTLVMSLWKVPDQQTQELMVIFYDGLLTGQSRVAALRQAQMEIKKLYPNPLYWGAFICQGDPGPLESPRV